MDISLNELYLMAQKLAKEALLKGFNQKETVKYLRNNTNQEILNIFCRMEKLNSEQMKMLGTKTPDIRFSMDSMIKNTVKHPELTIGDYGKLAEIIKNPNKIAFSKTQKGSMLFFKKDNKYYQAVVKTTKDKKENFLTSFRFMTEKEFLKY